MSATRTTEDKIQQLFEFALLMKNDPDFNRLVFPPAVLAKLAEVGVTVSPKEYSASAAVDKCLTMKSTERYVSTDITVIDQSKMDISFPTIPAKETDSLVLVEDKAKEEVKEE